MLFAALPHADRRLALAWWAVVCCTGRCRRCSPIAMGMLVAAVQRGDALTAPLAIAGVVFVLLQVLTPVQTAVSHTLGDRVAAFLYDRLTAACLAPHGVAHLEDPALMTDLTVARDFDRGMTGPPLSYSMDFIAGGLVGMIGGLIAAAVLFGFSWWAPFVLAGGWLSTHYLLRESAVWFDRNTDEVRSAQRDADYLLSAGGRSARQQGAAALRSRAVDDRALRQPGARSCISCSTTRRVCGSGRSR